MLRPPGDLQGFRRGAEKEMQGWEQGRMPPALPSQSKVLLKLLLELGKLGADTHRGTTRFPDTTTNGDMEAAPSPVPAAPCCVEPAPEAAPIISFSRL